MRNISSGESLTVCSEKSQLIAFQLSFLACRWKYKHTHVYLKNFHLEQTNELPLNWGTSFTMPQYHEQQMWRQKSMKTTQHFNWMPLDVSNRRDSRKPSSGRVFYKISPISSEMLILHNDFRCSRFRQNAISVKPQKTSWNSSLAKYPPLLQISHTIWVIDSEIYWDL